MIFFFKKIKSKTLFQLSMFACALKFKKAKKKKNSPSRFQAGTLDRHYRQLRLDSLHGGSPWAVWAVQLYPWSLPLDSNHHHLPFLVRATFCVSRNSSSEVTDAPAEGVSNILSFLSLKWFPSITLKNQFKERWSQTVTMAHR